MITTVTTSMINVVSITSVAGLTAAISVVAVVSLIFFLTIQELANAGGSHTSLRIARFFNIGILPLVITFAAIVVVKITEVL